MDFVVSDSILDIGKMSQSEQEDVSEAMFSNAQFMVPNMDDV